jgi:putative ABC transport system permease protein
MRHVVNPLLRRPLMPLLMVLQVALACAIACNALFLLQQKLATILTPDGVGDPAHLVVLHNIIPRGTPWPAAQLRTIQAELRTVPGVAKVSYAATFPMIGNAQMTADVIGMDPEHKAGTSVYLGDDLIDALDLKLLAGRDFTPGETAITVGGDMGFQHSGPVIISRPLADQLFPSAHALGQLVRYSRSPGGERTVVGVVAHLIQNKFGPGNRELDNAMLFPGVMGRWPVPMFAVRLKPSDESHACKALMRVIRRELGADLLPGNQPQCDPFTTLRDHMLAPQRAAVWLLSGVTLIVLIVTLTGIMGMTGYRVQQHTRSIGIRRALGARRRDILRELLMENVIVVGAGVVIGLIAAYGVNLWLMQHYELVRLPWTWLPIGAVLLLALGQLAVLVPARRASRTPPIVATRAV